MAKRYLFLTLLTCCAIVGQAKVKLSHLISDGMVIQQNSEVRLWGWDTPGKMIKVRTSWSPTLYTARAAADSTWMVKIHSPKASYKPLSITFNDGEATTVRNVLAGEVWLCGGQSNMEMPMRGWGTCPIPTYNEEMMNASRYSGVHYCTIPEVCTEQPQADANCKWQTVSANTLGDVSATAYYYARTLNASLNIPIGIIIACKGGSRIEGWLNKANIKAYTKDPLDLESLKKKYKGNWSYPNYWYNGTLYPTLKYTIKGFIFYQGCSNVGNPEGYYSRLMNVMVKQWRDDFALGNLPFYFVEIAPHSYGNVNRDNAARLREEQFKASKEISNCSEVSTVDLVYPWEHENIHPAQKKQVGERLAMKALKNQYAFTQLLADGAEYGSLRISNDTCFVSLKNMYMGFVPSGEQTGFEVAGSDKVFHKAKAVSSGIDKLKITCPEVKAPVAVRYCFRNFQLGSVHNSAGLPLFPFRTDNW